MKIYRIFLNHEEYYKVETSIAYPLEKEIGYLTAKEFFGFKYVSGIVVL